MKFTQSNVTKLKSPPGTRDHWEPDDSTPGFGIRFRNGGAGVFGLRYSIGGKDRRLSYEKVLKVRLDDARTWAKKQHAAIAEKLDPAVTRARAVARASSDGIDALIDDFISYLERNGRAASYLAENTRSLKVYFKPLHRFAASDINRAMVAQELARIRTERGPIAADRSRAHLSKFFGWAIGEGLAEHNPTVGTNKTGSKARERLLQDKELAAIWQALNNDDYGVILKLLILTAGRRDEVGSLSRREINTKAKQIELPGSRTKNGLDHIIPLSPLALSVLNSRDVREGSDFVFGRGEGGFSGWSQSKARLDAKLRLAPWVLHDFRRYVSTTMHDRLDVPPHIVEAVLGHISGHKGGVGGVYNRAQYLDQKRAALNAWADHVAKITAPN